MTDAEKLVSVLTEKNMTVSTAESCTGGLISGAITSVPGSSAVFGYGFVTYANDAKRRLTGVKPATLKKFGAVSSQTAFEMAVGARLTARSDYAVAATGIAGPDGGSDEKPVGLVYVAVASKNSVVVRENVFSGGRAEIRTQTVEEALKLLLSEITGG
ncbi:MAG: CinA family protein [Clostridia bacterium]|nr:CinA family protein [Clostridia bacterium]